MLFSCMGAGRFYILVLSLTHFVSLSDYLSHHKIADPCREKKTRIDTDKFSHGTVRIYAPTKILTKLIAKYSTINHQFFATVLLL